MDESDPISPEAQPPPSEVPPIPPHQSVLPKPVMLVNADGSPFTPGDGPSATPQFVDLPDIEDDVDPSQTTTAPVAPAPARPSEDQLRQAAEALDSQVNIGKLAPDSDTPQQYRQGTTPGITFSEAFEGAAPPTTIRDMDLVMELLKQVLSELQQMNITLMQRA